MQKKSKKEINAFLKKTESANLMNNFIANAKSFAIFFVVLMVIDVVLFIVAGGNVDRNYFYIVASNLALSGILQFFYIRFGKKGLYAVEVIVAMILLLTITEIILYQTYGVFMPLVSAINNAENVTANYADELVRVIAKNVTFIIRFLLFYAAFLLASNEYLIKKQEIKLFDEQDKDVKNINIGILIASIIVFILLFLTLEKTNDFSYNVQKNGLKSAIIKSFHKTNDSIKIAATTASTTKNNKEFLATYNVLDIDYENLDESNVDERCKNINKYVASRVPSKKNEYTGIFKGKNLILICAEAYSHHVINEKLTPTLYRLTNNGFKFTDFYVPSWGGSTTSGEFAFLSGLIPYDAAESMKNTMGKNMCFTMPSVLKREGYNTGAYHNGNYKYYDRHLTHRENIGFDYYIANGNGMEDIAGPWAPDEDMIEKTFESYHDKTPFCMYYMTLSGHAFYNDNTNFKVTKNIEKVKEVYGDKYPDQVNNYICYQLYLEDALKALVDTLEKYDLLDDTVICITSDHFPYGLNSASFTEGIDYIQYLYEKMDFDEFDIDKNMPILWCGSLEKEHKSLVKTIDEPTSTIDLLPTLLNLFGAEFDSRLLAGRDVFSDAEALVAYNNGSFITKHGKFSKFANKFIPNEGSTLSKNDIEIYKEVTKNLILFSAYVIEDNYYDYIFTNSKIPDDIKKSITTINIDVPVDIKKKDYQHFVEYFKKCNEKYLDNKLNRSDANTKKEKTVYLTFDDGPNNYSDEILDKLKKNNVKATFFVVGTNKAKELKKIKDAGHTIGLHSASHNYSYIYRSEEDYLWDLYELQNFVYQVTGKYSHYLRFPGGSKNKVSDEINYNIMGKLRSLVEELGFEYYDWHVATGDSSSEITKERILSNVERGLINNYDELIILMHDLHPVTVDAIDDVIDICKKHGYKFDKITDDTIPFHAIGVN